MQYLEGGQTASSTLVKGGQRILDGGIRLASLGRERLRLGHENGLVARRRVHIIPVSLGIRWASQKSERLIQDLEIGLTSLEGERVILDFGTSPADQTNQMWLSRALKEGKPAQAQRGEPRQAGGRCGNLSTLLWLERVF